MMRKSRLYPSTLYLFALLSFSFNSNATVAYIGDTMMSRVADKLEEAELENADVSGMIDDGIRSAAISNHQDWLPVSQQTLASTPIDAVVISLGKNDMYLRKRNFPGSQEIDASIAAILDTIGRDRAVFWVLPHESAAKRSYQKNHRQLLIKAIYRSKDSGNYPQLQVVDIDSWADQLGIEMEDLLAANKLTFSSKGAKLAAELVLSTTNDLMTTQ